MLSLKLAKADNAHPDSPTRLQLFRVASCRQIIVCEWLILAHLSSATRPLPLLRCFGRVSRPLLVTHVGKGVGQLRV